MNHHQIFKKIKEYAGNNEIRLLFIIIFLAFLLRIYGITFGLPYLYCPDELDFVSRAFSFGSGDLNPHWFGHPGSSLMYLLFVLYSVYFVIGFLLGIFPNIEIFEHLYHMDPTTFYLIGRTTTVLFGTFTVFFVYLVAERIYGKKVGVIAALFLSVSLLHVIHSQFIRTDVLATFFIMISFFFSLLIFEKNQLKYYILAGIFAGFAIATKYTSGIIIFPIIIAHFLREGKKVYEKENKLLNKNLVYLILFLCGILIVVIGFFADFFVINYVSPDGVINTRSLQLVKVLQIITIFFGFFIILITILMRHFKQVGNLVLNSITNRELVLGLIFVLIGFIICAPFFFLDLNTAIGNIVHENTATRLGAERLSGINNHLWYITNPLRWGLGTPIEILAGLGILYALYRHRKNELLLLSFPLIFWLAIGAMRLRWDRWIIPILPFLTIFAANFVVELIHKIPKSKVIQQKKNIFLAIVVLLLVLMPIYSIISHDYLISQKDTRTMGKEWIDANIPLGAKIAKERYTPPISNNFSNLTHKFSIGDKSLYYCKKEKFEYIIISSYVYNQYLAEPEKYPNQVKFYKDLFKEELVQEFKPNSKNIPGPTIKIYKLNTTYYLS